jgi:pimeloyl-ACP methyl ester carboxylesterase
LPRSIVFIHGAMVNERCWDPMKAWFEARGHRCLAPPWPERRPGLGLGELADHYLMIVRAEPEPPVLVGHSFGGLLVQILLDRGHTGAGVAIEPAPPRGVLMMQPSAVCSSWPFLSTWRGWDKLIPVRFEAFAAAFVHTLPRPEQRQVFETCAVPLETGRPFFQTAVAMMNPNSPCRIDFRKADRAPLLIIAGEADRTVIAAAVRANYQRCAASPAPTELVQYPNRTHWIMAQRGWEEVAGRIEQFISTHA